MNQSSRLPILALDPLRLTETDEPFDDAPSVGVGGGQIGSDGVEPAVGVATGKLAANAREAVRPTCDEDDVVVGCDSSGESGTNSASTTGDDT
jgi:hypothetical protein